MCLTIFLAHGVSLFQVSPMVVFVFLLRGGTKRMQWSWSCESRCLGFVNGVRLGSRVVLPVLDINGVVQHLLIQAVHVRWLSDGVG